MFRRQIDSRKSETAALRDNQIEGLRSLNPTACAVTPEQNVWDVGVNTQYGELKFRIWLPPGFPQKPPEMKLLVQATHPWCDAQLRILGPPRLQQWGAHQSLGMLVKDVVDEFAVRPPSPVANPVPPPPPKPQMFQGAQAVQQVQPPQRQPPQQQVFQPTIPETFPALDAFSTYRLQQLLSDDSLLQEVIEEQEGVQSMLRVRDDLLDSLEDLARKNLRCKDELDQLRPELETLRKEHQQLSTALRDLGRRQQVVLRAYSVPNLLQCLREAITQAEEDSQKVREEYEGNQSMSLDDFVKKYLEERILYHKRSARSERLSEQHGKRLL